MIELADKSVIIPERSLDDVTVTLASWEYPVEFLVIYSKSSSTSCRSGEMTISNGTHSQKLVLFPPTQPT
jgi:hypothetical protein